MGERLLTIGGIVSSPNLSGVDVVHPANKNNPKHKMENTDVIFAFIWFFVLIPNMLVFHDQESRANLEFYS